MNRPALGLIVVAAAALAAATVLDSTAGATVRVDATRAAAAAADVSANWSGYAATAGTTTFSDVTGTWKIPTATCTPGQSSSAAVWVGLGGYAANAQYLEQTGTSSDCSTLGKPSYYIWYEARSAGSGGRLGEREVHGQPGRHRHVECRRKHRGHPCPGEGSHPEDLLYEAARDEHPGSELAEWIVEAPSECGVGNFCRVVPLTNFGSVTFSSVSANWPGGTGGTLSANPGWTVTNIEPCPDPPLLR